jgi:hypothetical protein
MFIAEPNPVAFDRHRHDLHADCTTYSLMQYRDPTRGVTPAEREFYTVIERPEGRGFDLAWPEEDEASFRERCLYLASPLCCAHTLDVRALPDRAAAWTPAEHYLMDFQAELADAERQSSWLLGGDQDDWIVVVDKHQ